MKKNILTITALCSATIITALCMPDASAAPGAAGKMSSSSCDTGSILRFNPVEEVLPALLSARNGGHFKPDTPASLTLLHFTDLHGSDENLARVVEFRDAYSEYIDDAVHAGDAVICYWDNPNPFAEVPGAQDILLCIGNHDCWKGHLVWAQTNHPYDATAADAYSKFFSGRIGGWKVTQPDGVEKKGSPYCNACYYYKDYPKSRIRMIVLDCMHYDEVQDGWFAATLEEARAKGYQVVGVEHYPAQSGLKLIKCGFSSPTRGDLQAVPDPGESQMERMPDRCFATLDKFIDGGGTFICWLSGHTHSDFIGTIPGHGRQIQIIAEKSGEMDTYMFEDRTKGTRNQDAFNLITINPALSIFTIQRIGATRNEYMQSKKLLVYDYSAGALLLQE